MKYSFIIPAKNEEKLIRKCIASIHCSACANELTYEIIVADNLSTDTTVKIAQERGCAVVTSVANTIAGVRNTGARASTGDILIFVDADSEVNYDLIKETKFLIEACYYIGGGAKLKLKNCSPLGLLIVTAWNLLCRYKKYFTGSYIFIRRYAFIDSGQFDPRLCLCEDIEFSNRINTNVLWRTKLISNAHILTSERKLHLFSAAEHFKFIKSLLFNFKNTIFSRSSCFIHYEIRR